MPRPGASETVMSFSLKTAPPRMGSSLQSTGPSKSILVITFLAQARCTPAVVAILAPLFVGFGTASLFGKTIGAQALGGLLIGAISSGVCLAIMMANSGGAWDNAKKLIEEGCYGGKGSSSHQCAIIGDTVGDPFKDTSGPSLNILIKLMTIVALVCAGLFVVTP